MKNFIPLIAFILLLSNSLLANKVAIKNWKPGRVKAICSGTNNSFYLNTTGNPALIKADLKGKIIKTWGIGKDHSQLSPKDTALLKELTAMIADKKGNIFFIRSSTPAVYKLENNQISVFATFTSEDFKDDSWPGNRMDLTADNSGNLFVIDGRTQTIWKIDPLGKIENLNLKLKKDLVSKRKATRENTYIAATASGGLFFTSFSEDNDYFPDISFLDTNGNLKELIKGHNNVTKYSDGTFGEASTLKAYNLKTDNKGNLYFADDVSWAAGKTFWHFGSIRRLGLDGVLQTIAGCGSVNKETNTITTPYNAADRGWDLKKLTINGKEFTFTNQSRVRHQSLLYDDEISIQLESLGESDYGLFFRTGDSEKILFTVIRPGELVVAPDNTPLIYEQVMQGTNYPGSKEGQIRLIRVSLNDGVQCQPIIIHE